MNHLWKAFSMSLDVPRDSATVPHSFPPLVLDVTEAAAVLRLGRSTVYRMLESGELASVKAGRRRLITYASCVAYVEGLSAAS